MKLINHARLSAINTELVVRTTEMLKAYKADLMRQAYIAGAGDNPDIYEELVRQCSRVSELEHRLGEVLS